MSNTTERLVKEIDITVRYNGKDILQTLFFDDDDNQLTEEEMYDFGFCGDIVLVDEDGSEFTLSLDASNPEYYRGKVIDGLAFNLSALGDINNIVDFAEVISYEPIYE